VWDLATGREQATLSGHDGEVRAVAVTADGTVAVTGGGRWGGTMRVWDLATGREQATLLHQSRVLAVAVTADGTVAVSGSYDGTVRVWDLATGRERAKLPGDPDDPVWSVAVTADGTVAVSGSWHGTVRVWDLATGKEAAHWTGDSAIIACTPLSGRPLKIAVGQQQGQPYLLELRGQEHAS